MSIATIISNVLLALATGGVGLAVVNQIFARRRVIAEAESIEVDTAAKLLRGVTDELERMHARQKSLEDKFDACDQAREAAERRAREAERRAYETQQAESELRSHMVTLQRAYTITRRRVEYLTEVVKDAGIPVSTWSTPPNGIDPKEKA